MSVHHPLGPTEDLGKIRFRNLGARLVEVDCGWRGPHDGVQALDIEAEALARLGLDHMGWVERADTFLEDLSSLDQVLGQALVSIFGSRDHPLLHFGTIQSGDRDRVTKVPQRFHVLVQAMQVLVLAEGGGAAGLLGGLPGALDDPNCLHDTNGIGARRCRSAIVTIVGDNH